MVPVTDPVAGSDIQFASLLTLPAMQAKGRLTTLRLRKKSRVLFGLINAFYNGIESAGLQSCRFGRVFWI
jgi:hypothetical protein